MSKQVFTLKQVAASIRKTMEARYHQPYWVKAEVYKMNLFPSGHAFPELVQRENGKIVASLSGVIWHQNYQRIRDTFEKTVKEPLSEGKELLLEVRIVFHEIYGLSLQISDIDPNFSLGALHQLKLNTIKQLDQDQLLNRNKEFQLNLPKRIALISAASSKGLSDFYQVLEAKKHQFGIATFLFNCTLQGDTAIESILTALGKIRQLTQHFDAVAIVRGGGAEVGMSCYDDYKLCRTIAEFPLPVLCGIGHSTNLTVAEMVAYSHAITPSVLASNLLAEFEEAEKSILDAAHIIRETCRRSNEHNRSWLNQTSIKLSRLSKAFLGNNKVALSQMISSTNRSSTWVLDKKHQQIALVPYQLQQAFVQTQQREIRGVELNLQTITFRSRQHLQQQSLRVDSLDKQAQLMDPKSVLSRGYSIARKDSKALLSNKGLKTGDLTALEFYQGKVETVVK